MEGWIKLHRKFKEWEWYDKSEMVHLFIHLLLSANHEEKKWRGKLVKRGQLITGLHQLHKETKISIRSLRTCLSRLVKTGEIDKQSDNQYTIITICKYDSYNDYKLKSTSKSTSKRQANDKQATTNKNDKNNKNEKNIDIPTLADLTKIIIDYLNSKAGKAYRHTTDATKNKINARLNEGFTVDDFKHVIDVKCSQWKGDEKMDKFLRPDTLFGRNFEGYLNEKQQEQKEIKYNVYL